MQLVMPGAVADHPYLPLTRNYHHEIEPVAALGSGGRDVPIERALDLVYGYAISLKVNGKPCSQRTWAR